MTDLINKYKTVVARYTDDQGTDIAIIEYINGFYFVTYNYLTSPVSGSDWNNFKRAENQILKLRKNAVRCNSICDKCVNPDCCGTSESVWTGCVYRKTRKI